MLKPWPGFWASFCWVLGLFSFLPNPLVGENGYFAANLVHAALFGAAGLILLAFSLKGKSIAAAGLYFTGILFLALGVLGYRELDPHPYGNVNIFGVMFPLWRGAGYWPARSRGVRRGWMCW